MHSIYLEFIFLIETFVWAFSSLFIADIFRCCPYNCFIFVISAGGDCIYISFDYYLHSLFIYLYDSHHVGSMVFCSGLHTSTLECFMFLNVLNLFFPVFLQ